VDAREALRDADQSTVQDRTKQRQKYAADRRKQRRREEKKEAGIAIHEQNANEKATVGSKSKKQHIMPEGNM